jgi:hypothetical protein
MNILSSATVEDAAQQAVSLSHLTILTPGATD